MAKNDAASATREAIKKAKRRSAADYTEPKAKPAKKVAPAPDVNEVAKEVVQQATAKTYRAEPKTIRFIPPKGEYRVQWPGGVIRVFASPDGRVKARSRRGWTEQTPKQLAAIAARETEAKRKAGKEQARKDAAEGRVGWLTEGAKRLDPAERPGWLAAQGAPADMVTLISTHLAVEA